MISAVIRRLNIYRDFEEFRQAGRIALWQAWERFDGTKGDFTPFAYRSIQGAMLDELKREAKRLERLVSGEEEWLSQLPAAEEAHEDMPEWLETLALAKDEELLLRQLFLERLTIKEAAEAAGISPAGIKKRRERLLLKLKAQLHEAGRAD
nr:sigma-70 family RNA polymerase sigma factor [Indiicoccus explosivorum]